MAVPCAGTEAAARIISRTRGGSQLRRHARHRQPGQRMTNHDHLVKARGLYLRDR